MTLLLVAYCRPQLDNERPERCTQLGGHSVAKKKKAKKAKPAKKKAKKKK